jgi:hypothetical protein
VVGGFFGVVWACGGFIWGHLGKVIVLISLLTFPPMFLFKMIEG